MGILRSRKERLQEQAEHPGQNKYRIFYKDQTGKRVQVSVFWASDASAAKTELDVFLKKNALVNPDDCREYFYGSSGGIICDRGNGMEEEFDDFGESMQEDETLLEKIKYFFMPVVWKLRDIRYAFADFWYWFRHYDMRTNRSHQRSESWNLDSAVLDMLEFNIPIIMRDKNGVPNEFCVRARAKLHEGETGFDVSGSFRTNPNSSDTEMELASKMWDEELGRMLLHIRLYRYYSDYGISDGENDPAYVEIDRKYKDTIPYVPGTDSEIDYAKAGELIQREWRAIWEWMTEYGQSLWT